MRSLRFLIALLFAIAAHAADFHVGPGQTYANINDLATFNLTAGDNLYIHWRATPYREKFRLSGVGTAAQPIRVIGVSGPGGARPVINGENATSHPGDVWSTYGNNQSDGDGGLIMVRRGPGRPFNEKPAFISIEGLEITRARPVYTYTFWDGSTRQMGGGIWILGADDISILNCKIHDCSDGLFAKSNPTEESTTRRLLVKQCHIENCSENMAALGLTAAVHNIYTECFGITFEENYLGPTRIGSDGSNLKDRSSGTIIRYNWVEGGARNLDLVEADDSWPMVQADIAGGNLAYRTTQVYGNYFLSGPGQAVRPIHYGGDLGAPVQYRKGTLYFHHNTFFFRRDRDESYHQAIFHLETDDESAMIWNNVFHAEAATPGAIPSEVYLALSHGQHTFGPNWVKTGIGGWDNNFPPEAAGTLNGTANLIYGVDPGFRNPGANDLRLGAYSVARNIGGTLPANAHAVLRQYVSHRQSEVRPTVGIVDVGANEFVPPAGPVTPEAFPQTLAMTQNTPRAITLTGYDENGDVLTFTTTAPTNGTLSGTPPNVTYTPGANFLGADSFTFTANDGALTSPPATITLNVALPLYTLTVEGGDGDGEYLAGAVVNLTAAAAPPGQQFTSWAGATVANPLATTTTLTMPAAATTVAALFRPTPPPGGPFTYNVGPGQPLASLAAVPWRTLFPGDTVRLHWRATAYAEKVLIPARGTAAAPIRFIGVPGPAGQRPVISGLNATLAPNSGFASYDQAQFLGLITIARADTDSAFFKPGHIEISGLELRDIAETPSVWGERAAALQLIGAECVTIRDCEMHHTCSGLVARLAGGEFGLTRDLRILNCHFHDTGTVGQYVNANINTEVAGLLVRGCRLDAPIAGSFSDNLIDRSAGTVIEACRIEGAQRMVELAAPVSGGYNIIRNDPRFTTTRLAGCLILATHFDASILWVGDDTSEPMFGSRTGTFEMHHNTVIVSTGAFQSNVPNVSAAMTVDFRHNIIRRTGTELIQILDDAGTLNSGVNWLSPGWQPSPTATVNGTAAILTNAGNNPQLDANFAPLPASQCRDTAAALLVASQFTTPSKSHLRLAVGPAADLGAIESGLAAPTASLTLGISAQPTGPRLTLTATPNAAYALESSPDLATWQPFAAGIANGAGVLEITDTTAAGQPKRFYRGIIE